jgi:hypothetical protein
VDRVTRRRNGSRPGPSSPSDRRASQLARDLPANAAESSGVPARGPPPPAAGGLFERERACSGFGEEAD